ncbi:MAG: sodium/proline symporter, partial [Chlamydiales bacterium]|nr:sodium/proline symporter [Chlamydiales bacterium]
TKFMAIKNVKDLRKSKYLGIGWQILALTSAAAIGFIGIAFFQDGLQKPEMIFVEMSRTCFPPFVAALIICGVFAANMSTMDAQILVCATVLSEDFYKRTLNKNASAKQVLMASRMSVLLFASLAFYMAYGQSATIMSIVEYAWSGLGSSFGPLILVAIYSKVVNRYGAIAGIVSGGGIAAIWPTINPLIMDLEVIPMIPAFFGSLAMIYVVSYATKSKEIAVEAV